MKIDCLVLGAYQTNCYIIRQNDKARDCLIVDTGLDAAELIEFLKAEQLNPLAVVLTHGHADHITGLKELRTQLPDIKVYIHKLDAEMLTGAKPNLSEVTDRAFKTAPADFLVDQDDVIEQASIKLRVMHTPGHTAGGISLNAEQQHIVFVGDTLFAGSVGRTDLPGGSMTQLIDSIKQKLLTLPDETVIYPGHGPQSTIGTERMHNSFLR